jgi:hypothetical protein
MPHEAAFTTEGTITAVLPGTMFRVDTRILTAALVGHLSNPLPLVGLRGTPAHAHENPSERNGNHLAK